MSDATKQLEDELRQKHNEVFRLEFQDTSGPGAVYFRALTAPEYNAALEKIMDKDAKRNALALKEVARRVLIHPTDDALEAIPPVVRGAHEGRWRSDGAGERRRDRPGKKAVAEFNAARGSTVRAARALRAFLRDDTSAQADAGAMIVAEFLLSVTSFLTKK